MTNQEIILTEKEIKELIGSLNRNPDETEIRAVIDYFWLRPYALKHLEDKEFRKSFVHLIYMHKNAMNWWVKANKEVKRLQPLTISLEKERNELLEKIKELEERVEELDDEVWMEREEAEKALNKAMEWRKWQMFETVLKHDAAMGKLQDRIDLLENNLAAKNQETNWKDYLATKELPFLPKKQKENRLCKLKKLVSRAKEKAKEKFQTFIVQKNK